MSTDRLDVVRLLERDVEATLGDPHRELIASVARDVEELDVAAKGEKIVNDIQQYFHDTSANTTWPTCPRHAQHPLWYRDGSWWCVQDGVAVARLGELTGGG